MPFYLTHQQVIFVIQVPLALDLSNVKHGFVKKLWMFLYSQAFLQVLVAILSGALWVPYLGSFPITLLLATVATFVLSLIITKMGPIRYLHIFNRHLIDKLSALEMMKHTEVLVPY